MAPPYRWLFASLMTSILVGSASALQELPRQWTDQDLKRLEIMYLNEVVVVVGDQVVTRRDMLAQFQKPEWRNRVMEAESLPAEQANAVLRGVDQEVTAEIVEVFLEMRAGQDRGFDPGLVDRLVDRRFSETVERIGGFEAFHAELKRNNSTPEQFKEQTRRSLYRLYWRGAVTANQPGTTGRLEQDRYVHPGQLRSAYRQFRNSPRSEERDLTGIKEAKYDLLEFAMGFQQMGGRDPAVERVRELRTDLVAGKADMEELINYWFRDNPEAKKRSRLTLTPRQVATVSQRSFGGRAFQDFLNSAKPGDLSPPLESAEAVHLIQLVAKSPADPGPGFVDFSTQTNIRNHILDRQATMRLGKAHQTLIQKGGIRNSELRNFMLDPSWLYREDPK